MKKNKLTSVDKCIKRMMMEYPSLFPSRRDCQLHLFSTIGGGYRWNLKTGELFCVCDDKKPNKHIELELEEIEEYDSDAIVFRKEHINICRKHIWDNIDIVVNDIHHSTQERDVFSIYSLSWDEPGEKFSFPGIMQLACIHKDKIKKEWKQEIVNFCKWIISEVRSFIYCPSQKEILTNEEILEMLKPCRHIRKMNELRSAFYTAVKVLDNIYTEEEKIQNKKREQKLVEISESVVKKMLSRK